MSIDPKHWLLQILASIDKIISGLATPFSADYWSDETFSARCYRNRNRPQYKILMNVINIIYRPFQGKNHCENAYNKSKAGYHRPPEMR